MSSQPTEGKKSKNPPPPAAANMAHVRLTPTEAAGLDALIHQGHYQSRSHALRKGLHALFTAHGMGVRGWEDIERERLFHRERSTRKRYLRVLRPGSLATAAKS